MLLGHSAGGVVAFEMARQLAATGQAVSFLGLLDADFPRPRRTRRRYPLQRQLINFLRTPPKYIYRSARALVRDKFLTGQDDERNGGSSLSTGYRARFTHQILENYRPQIYSGTIHFFKSAAPIYPFRTVPTERGLEWAGFASGDLEMHEVSGDHMEIVKNPLAGNTASVISACLDKIEEAPDSPPQADRHEQDYLITSTL